MSRSRVDRLSLLCCLAVFALPGCVKRVYEAPGLPPGSTMAVAGDMRVDSFEVERWEVRVFRIPLSDGNRRLYQFIVLKGGVFDHDYSLEQLEDGKWALIERRSDGISVTRKTYTEEPVYTAVKSEVVGLLRQPGYGGRRCDSA